MNKHGLIFDLAFSFVAFTSVSTLILKDVKPSEGLHAAEASELLKLQQRDHFNTF